MRSIILLLLSITSVVAQNTVPSLTTEIRVIIDAVSYTHLDVYKRQP